MTIHTIEHPIQHRFSILYLVTSSHQEKLVARALSFLWKLRWKLSTSSVTQTCSFHTKLHHPQQATVPSTQHQHPLVRCDFIVFETTAANMASPRNTGSSAGQSSAALLLAKQFKQIQTDKDIPGISCGLVGSNVFEWEVMLMLSEDQDSLYGGE
jgi:hypothetical protein